MDGRCGKEDGLYSTSTPNHQLKPTTTTTLVGSDPPLRRKSLISSQSAFMFRPTLSFDGLTAYSQFSKYMYFPVLHPLKLASDYPHSPLPISLSSCISSGLSSSIHPHPLKLLCLSSTYVGFEELRSLPVHDCPSRSLHHGNLGLSFIW